MKKLSTPALPVTLVAFASADCSATVSQTLGSAWTTNGQDMSQWSVAITNTGSSEAVKSVDLTILNDNLFEQVWNIVKDKRGPYVLPDYVTNNGGIAVGGSYQFGYIIKSKTQAIVTTVAPAKCGSVASASPAAPRPRPPLPRLWPRPPLRLLRLLPLRLRRRPSSSPLPSLPAAP
jgi:hypothetical protein